MIWKPYNPAHHTLQLGTHVRYWNFYYNSYPCGEITNVSVDNRGCTYLSVFVPVAPDSWRRTYLFIPEDLASPSRMLHVGVKYCPKEAL